MRRALFSRHDDSIARQHQIMILNRSFFQASTKCFPDFSHIEYRKDANHDMKSKQVERLFLQLASLLLSVSMTCFATPQSGNSGKGGTGGGGNSGSGGGGQGGQTATSQQSASPSSSSSGRIEATMLAYEASDKIATYLADQVKAYRLFIYDNQTFASLQTYDAYAATVSAFEMSFRLITTPSPEPSNLTDFTSGLQSIVGTLGALRSTSEYTAQTVDFNGDALIAQVAHRLPGSVIVPKMLLLSNNDLTFPDVNAITDADCANIQKTVPHQLGCLLKVRKKAANGGSDKDSFKELDKLFQAFFGTLMGTSVNIANKATDAKPLLLAPGGSAAENNANNPNQTMPVSLLSSIIQGHRLESELRSNKNSRVLVLQATAAGGGSRIKHNFWVELFYTTPVPTFTGGAVVSYLLIDPDNSTVEKAGVLRFIFDYGKFHGNKLEKQSNFP